MIAGKMAEEPKCEILTFKIFGDDFTNLCRGIWADEGNPDKGLKIVEAAFPQMSESERLSILTGENKLVGDSSIGMDLVEDGTKLSPGGNSLALDAVMSKILKKKKELQDEVTDLTQLAGNATYRRGSKVGLIEIPMWRQRALERGEVDLYDDVIYRNVSQEPNPCRSARQLSKDEKKPVKRKLPEYGREISGPNGWLLPDGKFYPCGFQGHIETAYRLGYEEREAEKLGWIKISSQVIQASEIDPSQKQIDLIFDYCQKLGKGMPYWMTKE